MPGVARSSDRCLAAGRAPGSAAPAVQVVEACRLRRGRAEVPGRWRRTASSRTPSLSTFPSLHDLAHERVVLRAGCAGRGFLGIVFAQAEIDLHIVAEPRAHVWHELR